MKVVKKNKIIRPHRINTEILAVKVRLTDPNGSQIGIMNLSKALMRAQQYNLDLVEISPNADPPVCKIMDYGKFLYEKNKAIKNQKKKQKIVQIKEIKFRPNTDEADYQVKRRHLIRFLESGDKVKITLRFRGREMAHYKIGLNVLNRLKKDLESFSNIEYFPFKIEGRQMTMILSPKRSKK